MNEELRALRDSAQRLLQDAPPAGRDQTEETWATGLWGRSEALGMTMLGVPEEAGGSGGGMAALAQVLHVAGGHGIRLPFLEHAVAAWALAMSGVAMPDGLLTLCTSPARPDGTLEAVPWARHAERVIVLAADGHLVSARVGPRAVLRGSNLAGEPRDNIPAPEQEASVALPPGGLDRIRYREALARSLMIAGAARRVLDLTIAHAAQRQQFGRPISAFQSVQHQLVDLAGSVRLLDAVNEAAVLAVDRGDETALVVCAARICAGETATTAARVGHQVHGAIGYTDEHPVGAFTRRLLSWRDEAGTRSSWQREFGRLASGRGSAGVWDALVRTPVPAPQP